MATQINLSFLIETTKGNKDMISEIVSEVIKHIEEFSSSLPALKGKRDFTNIALESHKFKSSIQIIGAPTAYITIQNLENAAKNKDEIEVSSLSETVLQLIAVCHLELLAYMNLY